MPDRLSLPFSGARLQTTRERAGLTRQNLAERCASAGCRVSVQHVRRLEIGETPAPRPPLLKALTEALGVQVDDLLTEAVSR